MKAKGWAASWVKVNGPPPCGCWRHVWSLSFFWSAVACLLYVPTLDHDLFADDSIYLGFVSSKWPNLSVGELPRFLFERMNPWEFLPLRDFSYWLDMTLLGGFPDGYHFSNLLWYVAACFSAGLLIRTLIEWSGRVEVGQRQALVMLGVALFALHPAHVEPVAWIAGRKDLMAGTFGFWSLSVFLQGMERGYTPRHLVKTSLLLVATLFSKGAAVGLVLVFPVFTVARSSKVAAAAWQRVAYFAVPLLVAAAGALIHSRVGGETGIAVVNILSLTEFLERASRIWAILLGIMLWPVELRLIYDVYGIPAWHWAVLASSLAGVAWAGWSLFQGRRSLTAVGILIAAASCLPYLQFMPFTTWSMASERFVFVALLGPILAGLDLILKMERRGRVTVLVILGMALIPAWQTKERVDAWAWTQTLMESQFRTTPTYFNGLRLHLGTNVFEANDFEGARQLIQRVPREDARELLGLWEDVAIEYARLKQTDLSSSNDAICVSEKILRQRIESEFEKSRVERDMAYISLLRGLSKYLELNAPKWKNLCLTRRV